MRDFLYKKEASKLKEIWRDSMQFKIPHKRSLLCSAISMSLLPISGVSLAQDQVEEVVVTGSFIRRSEGFTQASSVTQLNAADLEAQGTLNLPCMENPLSASMAMISFGLLITLAT